MPRGILEVSRRFECVGGVVACAWIVRDGRFCPLVLEPSREGETDDVEELRRSRNQTTGLLRRAKSCRSHHQLGKGATGSVEKGWRVGTGS